MDPHLLDLVWTIYHPTGSHDYIHVVWPTAPATNEMLRRRRVASPEQPASAQQAMDCTCRRAARQAPRHRHEDTRWRRGLLSPPGPIRAHRPRERARLAAHVAPTADRALRTAAPCIFRPTANRARLRAGIGAAQAAELRLPTSRPTKPRPPAAPSPIASGRQTPPARTGG
jgi:hypothetical protein